MRRFLHAVLTVALLLSIAAPASAHPRTTLGPTLPDDLTYSATDNVEYLGRFPEHIGTAGGHPSADGKLFYLTDPRGVYVYDTTDPASPTLLDSVAIYQSGLGAALAQEDPDTNGKILLVDGATTPHGTAALQVVDVSDPRDIKIVSSVAVTDHTWECVTGIDATGAENNCAFAYGRTGHIIDLRDPAAATLSTKTWRQPVKYTAYTHDLTEVRPGLVMSAGATNILMDTKDPLNPVKLTAIDQRTRFTALGYHSVEWANGGRDPFVVMGTEIAPTPGTGGMSAGSDCKGDNSVIETWDATEIIAALDAYEAGTPVAEAFATAAFRKIDTFSVNGRGLFLDGAAPGNVLYCAHWMEQHPNFANGGLVTVSYYDRGTRFLKVDAAGKMSEVGWITAAEGYSGSSQWMPQDVVYIMDYRRGLEVVRLKPEPATDVVSEAPAAVAVGSRYVPVSSLSLQQGSTWVLALFAATTVGVQLRARRRRSA